MSYLDNTAMNTCSVIDEGIPPPIVVPEEKVTAIPAAHDRSSAVDESIRSLIHVPEDEDAAIPAVHDDHPDDIELHKPMPSPYSRYIDFSFFACLQVLLISCWPFFHSIVLVNS